jgi:hypothetical protein
MNLAYDRCFPGGFPKISRVRRDNLSQKLMSKDTLSIFLGKSRVAFALPLILFPWEQQGNLRGDAFRLVTETLTFI